MKYKTGIPAKSTNRYTSHEVKNWYTSQKYKIGIQAMKYKFDNPAKSAK